MVPKFSSTTREWQKPKFKERVWHRFVMPTTILWLLWDNLMQLMPLAHWQLEMGTSSPWRWAETWVKKIDGFTNKPVSLWDSHKTGNTLWDLGHFGDFVNAAHPGLNLPYSTFGYLYSCNIITPLAQHRQMICIFGRSSIMKCLNYVSVFLLKVFFWTR